MADDNNDNSLAIFCQHCQMHTVRPVMHLVMVHSYTIFEADKTVAHERRRRSLATKPIKTARDDEL